ncbi:MAG TPA: hypothetical protein VLQ45_30125, partial [Thermoanaerobaculia bacterium]|nr:hypothetical protein [Thermoanaerobaculia bacterium]
ALATGEVTNINEQTTAATRQMRENIFISLLLTRCGLRSGLRPSSPRVHVLQKDDLLTREV